MQFTPQVSVVLPVWNGERFLAEAIESILTQTMRAFELVIVDDGSTDGSAAIAQEFARRDPRVRFIQIEHSGIAVALNTAIREACSAYIARMDGDDVSLPMRLEKQIAYLDAHPECVVIGCDIQVINEEGEQVGEVHFANDHAEISRALIGGVGLPFSHPAAVMRKEAFLSVGGYRAASVPSEDLDLWLRMIEVGRFSNIAEPLLRYRRHTNTVCAREHSRQVILSTELLNKARQRRGLAALKPWRSAKHHNAIAVYHTECARFALRAGKRRQTIRHANASIALEPFWLQPYATLAACMLPTRVALFFFKCATWLRRTLLTSAAIE